HAKEVANPSQDNFLISPDKNPNRAGVEALGFKPLTEERRYQCFFILGDLPFSRLQKIAFEKNTKFVVFATHDPPTVQYADSLLPVAPGAEEEGTFTNKQKRSQRVHPAFPPPGEALAVWQWTARLAKVWGSDQIRYEHFSHVLADLAESIPAFKGMN